MTHNNSRRPFCGSACCCSCQLVRPPRVVLSSAVSACLFGSLSKICALRDARCATSPIGPSPASMTMPVSRYQGLMNCAADVQPQKVAAEGYSLPTPQHSLLGACARARRASFMPQLGCPFICCPRASEARFIRGPARDSSCTLAANFIGRRHSE